MSKYSPSPGVTPPNSEETEKLERYRWLLNQNVPVIGGWMHKRVLLALAELALKGNPHAVESLAMALVTNRDQEVRKLAEQTLLRINFATGIDAAWRVWTETRHPRLEEILEKHGRVASHPASARLLSALKLNDLGAVTRGSADLMAALIAACGDRDPQLAERARAAIQTLKNPASIDAVCRHWQENRSAFLAGVIQSAGYVAQKPPRIRVLSALKVDQMDVVMQSSAEMVPHLIEACQDRDPQVAERARTGLLHLEKQAAVDAFCARWAETRDPLLEEALLKAGYRARHPIEVRLLAALKTGQRAVAEKTPAQGLLPLLEATHDADEVIAQEARAALGHLQKEETREALCLRVI